MRWLRLSSRSETMSDPNPTPIMPRPDEDPEVIAWVPGETPGAKWYARRVRRSEAIRNGWEILR